jgi:protoporphyrinogen oxidase
LDWNRKEPVLECESGVTIRSQSEHAVIIIGAGPAGLTAAYTLVKQGIRPLVLEKSVRVGGLARTDQHRGYRYDIGGHRFFTKVPEVQQLWNEVLGGDFIRVPRLSRIHYRGRFFNYPIELWNAFSNLGVLESVCIALSYVKWKWRPYPVEESFEQWVTNRFGRRLYQRFFQTYTEKVWGIPCDQIRADWAAQRIKGLSLKTAVTNALFGGNDAKTLLKEFEYPKLGPGMMWDRFHELVASHGGEVRLETDTVSIVREGNRVTHVVGQHRGSTQVFAGKNFISSMPLSELIFKLDPPPPAYVLEAAQSLSYRDFLIVGLSVEGENLFPDNWRYVHTPGVRVGRIQNFGNWSALMVPEPGMSSLGMEYFCTRGDDLWEMADTELVELASRELLSLGLIRAARVHHGVVIRQEKAYPVYDDTYRQHVSVLRDYLSTIENLQTTGRNGLHRYNNQDHSMLTAILAVKNILGEKHDLWDINTERSYHENFIIDKTANERLAGMRVSGVPASVKAFPTADI